MKRWLPYILIPVCVAALWWTPPVQRYIHRSVETAVVERYNEKQRTTVTPGPHEHGMDQLWFPRGVVPETLFVDRAGRTVLRAEGDTIRVFLDGLPDDDHERFGLGDSSGVVYEVTSFVDWLLDPDRINGIGMLVLVVGTALSKVVAMMVKAIRGKSA